MDVSQSPRVLIVEDDADTRDNLCDILELDGYEVEKAGSAADAFGREDLKGVFAVLLDRRLPDGMAEEILPQLQEVAPDAAVVIVTGYADLDGAIAALRLGAEDYILKPVDPQTLRSSIRRVLKRKRAEEALRRSEHELRLITDNVPALISSIGADERYRFVNKQYEQYFGLSRSDIVGRHIRDLVGVEGYELIRRHIERVLAGERVAYEALIPFPCRGPRWIHVVYVPDLDDQGTVSGFYALVTDITARKRAEEEALRKERLAAIGQMVAGLAHESRNALQRSQACLEMLELEVEDRSEAMDLVSRIQRAQDHLHHLYEEVRGYAAPINIDRQRCDLRSVWRETWEHLDVARDKKEVTLREEIEVPDLGCEIDPHFVHQLFRNILENAIAACPEPGEITVKCAETHLDRTPAIRISFIDNGPGLSEEAKSRMFDPFFTTKTHGTGLGMAIAKRIAEAHGGLISIGNCSHSGAEIIVTLPRTAS